MNFNHRVILKVIGIISLVEGVAMLPSVICAVYYNERCAASALFITSICSIGFGYIVFTRLKYYKLHLQPREGYFIAFISWILVIIIGAIPYLLCGANFTFIDSFFESTAGWTTTGASVIDINLLPKSLILWKAMTHWLGGMGVLILLVSLFPLLGIGGQTIAEAEAPGPNLEKISTRIADTAKIFYIIYFVFTIIELILLSFSSLSPFDALVNTLCTISTAGISSNAGGLIAHFTPYVKTIVAIFSILASINFVIFYFMINKRWKDVLKDTELRAYLGIIFVSFTVIAFFLKFEGGYKSVGKALSDSFMQTVSFASTSGYVVADYNSWPTTCKIILLCLMFIGGCSLSTSGSIKVARIVVFYKLIVRGIYKRIHPKSVKPIMVSGGPVSAKSVSNITVFILLYLAFYIFSCIIMSLDNLDMETTLSATLAAFSNVGIGFGQLNGANNVGDFSIFSPFFRLYASVIMISGRLEMYAIIILLSRSFWNSDRV